MSEWTDSAREELQSFFTCIRTRIKQSDVDADEVIDDLRRHIDEEVRAAKLQVVTRQNIRQITAALWSPGEGVPQETAPESAEPDTGKQSAEPQPVMLTPLGLVAACIFGVFLPAVTLLFELLTRICSTTLFNPLPTIGHILLIGLVPVVNLLLACKLYKGDLRHGRMYSWLNGMVIGVTLVYTLFFLPFTPFAVMAVVFLIGFIPLAPLFALITAIILRLKFRAHSFSRGLRFPAVWTGLASGVLLLLLLSLPQIITQTGLRLAVSRNAETSTTGVRMLRALGNETTLLRSCYISNRLALDPIGLVLDLTWRPVQPGIARPVYYRVYGRPFNAVKPPPITGFKGGTRINAAEFDFEQGGDAVAARLRGLYLQQSRLDSMIDADAGTSYTEWTLEFCNESFQQREARAQIELPPGGVVSRLTLWIDGEEREAAFNARATVKDAYQTIVRRRRDPVLVTTCGPDRIVLQCFPVPPDGGTMKTRIGITAPVMLASYDQGLVRMPTFVERNFSIQEDLEHAVWIEAATDVQPRYDTETLLAGPIANQHYAVRGSLTDAVCADGFSVRVERDPAVRYAWALNERSGGYGVVQQIVEELPARPPGRLAVVIDGSFRMTACTNMLARALSAVPSSSQAMVLLAGDRVRTLAGPAPGIPAGFLSTATFAGGCDNVSALLEAWKFAAEEPDSVILWLHGTQPIDTHAAERLLQSWQRMPDNPLLYDLQFGPGPNTIAETLNGLPAVTRVARLGHPEDDLRRVLNEWNGTQPVLRFVRSTAAVTNSMEGVHAGLHLARLWARDTVAELSAQRGNEHQRSAVDLAMAYQLVTPVSGAVVLESRDQYIEAGLEPVDPATTPDIIPEPGAIVLMFIAGSYFIFRRR